jgi:hypothetical protein
MSELSEMFGDRAKCEAGECKFLGRLAASGVCVERAIEAGRQAAVLPYAKCADGMMLSKPDRHSIAVPVCGMRHEVQTGALAVAAYTEASAVSWPGLESLIDRAAAETVILEQPVLEQQP